MHRHPVADRVRIGILGPVLKILLLRVRGHARESQNANHNRKIAQGLLL
jgi:hypothetical protein